MKPRKVPAPKTSNVDAARNAARELLERLELLGDHDWLERWTRMATAAGHTWIKPVTAYVNEGQQETPMAPAEIARLLHVAPTTIYSWHRRYGMAFTLQAAMKCQAERRNAPRGPRSLDTGRTA